MWQVLTARPSNSSEILCHSSASLQELLEAVGLEYLLLRGGGLDAIEDWADSLSLGEQQRLGTAPRT